MIFWVWFIAAPTLGCISFPTTPYFEGRRGPSNPTWGPPPIPFGDTHLATTSSPLGASRPSFETVDGPVGVGGGGAAGHGGDGADPPGRGAREGSGGPLGLIPAPARIAEAGPADIKAPRGCNTTTKKSGFHSLAKASYYPLFKGRSRPDPERKIEN